MATDAHIAERRLEVCTDIRLPLLGAAQTEQESDQQGQRDAYYRNNARSIIHASTPCAGIDLINTGNQPVFQHTLRQAAKSHREGVDPH